MMQEGKKHNNLIKGIAFLAIAGVIVKILGALFRVFLGNIIGSEGMAIYQPAYSIYAAFVAFATVGLPVAISSIISKKNSMESINSDFNSKLVCDNPKKTLINSLRISIYIVTPLAVLLFVFSSNIANALGIPEAMLPIKGILPAIIFLTITASFRGYFQGYENMRPTGVSQVIEQLVRTVLGVVLASLLFLYGNEIFVNSDQETLGAFGATLGSSIGVLCGMIIIIGFYFNYKRKNDDKKSDILIREKIKYDFLIKNKNDILSTWTLVKMSIITTVGLAIFQVFSLIEVPIIVNSLVFSGMSEDKALDLYGQLSGMVYPIMNIPYIIVASISVGLVPKIIGNFDEMKENIKKGKRLGLIVGLPAGIGIGIVGNDILSIFYPSMFMDFDISDQLMICIGIIVVVLSLVQVEMGILYGLGKLKKALGIVIIGICFKTILSIVLVMELGLLGAPISTFVSLLIMLILSNIVERKSIGVVQNNIWKVPVIAVGIMTIIGIASKIITEIMEIGSTKSAMIIILVCVIAYGIVLKKLTFKENGSIIFKI